MSKFGNWIGGASSVAILAASVYLYATHDLEIVDSLTQDHIALNEHGTIDLPRAFDQVSQPLPLAPSSIAPPINETSYSYIEGETIPLNPYLIKALEDRAEVRGYLTLIKESYDMYGIDWRIGANMLFRESSHFRPSIVAGGESSNRGAHGIAQFTEATAADYGFLIEEIIDPSTAISLNASHMNNLRNKYDGDMALALIAYNGGTGAVDWIRESLGDPAANGEAAIEFLQERRNTLGNTSAHAYHVETLDYTLNILGLNADQWENPQWVQSQNDKLNDPVFAAILGASEYIEIAAPEIGLSRSLRPLARPWTAATDISAQSNSAVEVSLRPKARPQHILQLSRLDM